MLEFEINLLLTGVEKRLGRKEGSSYILFHVMGDNGQTLSFMYKGDENKIFSLEKMKNYTFKFSYNANGQFKNINILDVITE